MKKILIFALVTTIALQSCSQPNSTKQSNVSATKVGGPCEGCEAIYESTVPFEQMNSIDTLPDFNDKGPKIEISGIVYQRDGKTPAKDVVLYVYHTGQTGIYPKKGNETGWAKRHGFIRGWVKTDQNGFYQFYTLRPAAYPDGNNPQHIHITVKEPGKNEYWIDEYLFADDPIFQKDKSKQEQRGGNGVIELVAQKNGIAHGTRHIILGVNVPGYPYAGLPKLASGLTVGSNSPAFVALNLSGIDSSKRTCPICMHGDGQGIMIWFNHPNLDHMSNFLKALEKEMTQRDEKKLRVFAVYMNPFYKQNNPEGNDITGRKLREWCAKQNLTMLVMLWRPSPVE